MRYLDYLQTEHWQQLRKRTLENPYYGRPNECFVCKAKYELRVHHLTYVNKGQESDEDLVILCSTCHDKIHIDRKGRVQTKNIWMKVFELKYRPVHQIEESNLIQKKIKRYDRKLRKGIVRKKGVNISSYDLAIKRKNYLIKKIGTIAYYQRFPHSRM